METRNMGMCSARNVGQRLIRQSMSGHSIVLGMCWTQGLGEIEVIVAR